MGRSVTVNGQGAVVGYIRVSTAAQGEEGVGLDAQAAALRRYCEARGLQLLTIEQDTASGTVEVAKRPGLLRALALLRTHKGATLLAYRRDRLARDVVVAATVERLVAAAGGQVATVEGDVSGTGPEAVLMRTLLDAFAQFERGLIASRTRAALGLKKQRGERTGEVPLGYRLAGDGVHLVEHAGEQEVLRQVAELRASGMSLRAIVGELAERGVLNRAARPHTLTSVARMAKAVA
jgi:site-specific DNA recombinase